MCLKKTIYFFCIKLILSLSIILILSQKSFACLGCSCGSSSSSSDLGTIGAISGIFSKNKSFLLQFGISYRDITGSFNEISKWNTKPEDSNISSLSNNISLMYFPDKNISIGIQVPIIINFFSNASYGSYGSIIPTDSNFKSSSSLGDINFQFTYKVYEENNLGFIPWIRLEIPTGQSVGDIENISGSGLFKPSLGIIGIKSFGKFEIIFNIGYQYPLGSPVNSNISFYPGEAIMSQINTNYEIIRNIKIGLGLSTFYGKLLYNNNSLSVFKSKILSTLQYEFSMYNGIGLSIGYEPYYYGKNITTENNINLVFYQFF